MVVLNEAQINDIIIHRVGNSHKEEGVYLSAETIPVNENLQKVILSFFTKGFKQAEEMHKFSHPTDLNLNEVYHYCSQYFDGEIDFIPFSTHITNLLYRSSDHPMIKSGELIVAHIDEVIMEGEICDALVLVKCENKRDFIEFKEHTEKLVFDLRKGIHLNRIDKGVVIVNTESESGFRAVAVDSVNDQSQFWVERFLQLVADDPAYQFTENTINLMKDFASSVVSQQDENPTAKFEIMHKSMDFLQDKEEFNVNEFVEEVLPTPAYKEQFMQMHETMTKEAGLEDIEGYKISQPQVKKAKKQFKDLIKLDNGVQIQLKFNNESTTEYLEKGYDSEKGMHFYKVYFSEEE